MAGNARKCKTGSCKRGEQKMLRKLIIISIVGFSSLLFAQTGFCVPAVTSSRQITQPDGNTFSARLWGDEKAHGWETTDGYTIIEDPETKFWRYAQKQTSTGRMLPAGIVGAENATAGLSRHLRPAKTTNLRRTGSSVDRMLPKSINHTPITGSRPIPVMMVNFIDTVTTFDATDFENALFGTGTNSLKDYYTEVSYGAFSVSPGPAGVTGWYTAAKTHNYYGQNDVDGYDSHPAELVIETITAADASIDFSKYDSDGDCYVDAVVIVHQDSGEEAGGPAADIWSHQWDLFSAEYFGDGTGVYTTNDVGTCGNIKIKDYVIQPETLYGDIQTVGVFAHEYGHVLGLPDLYDIDYSSNGIGNWGLMSGGAWGSVHRPGDSPVHLSAWSKYMLGWIDPVPVTTRLADETIDPASAYDDVYQFFPDNDITSQEYYLIENRQSIGFDAGLPGTGLAIWHIDENKASSSNHDNSYECVEPSDCTNTHYRVALVQADGYWDLETGYNRGDTGDLFPGASGNTQFTSTSDPDSLLYDGSKSHVDITDITETGTAITASLALTYAITPSATSGGVISPGSKTTLDLGDDMTFAITPQAGYRISQVYIDNASVGALSEYTFSDTQVDHTINAVFTSTAPSGGGSGGGGGCFISSTF
jgi:immune inhibitor A